MGYALFTARKLAINTRLNACNAQLMSATNREYALTQSIFQKQQALAMKSNQDNLKAMQEYSAALESGTDSAQAKAKLDEKLAKIQMESTMGDAEIFELNQQQSLLDLEKKNLETQLKAFQNELESVQKAEETAIKNSTPKF